MTVDRIDINSDEYTHVRFHTDKGAINVYLDRLSESDVLRVSAVLGTIAVLPLASNVVLVRVNEDWRARDEVDKS